MQAELNDRSVEEDSAVVGAAVGALPPSQYSEVLLVGVRLAAWPKVILVELVFASGLQLELREGP